MQTTRHSLCSGLLLAAATLGLPAGLPAQQVNSGPTRAAADETIVLSPFTVSSEADRGYQALNTLSGTRLNSKLEDLGASITVVTKQQMQDTRSLDLNDIFLYEANTEGTGNYTQFTPNRNGGVIDGTANDPATANRIRGVGSPISGSGVNIADREFLEQRPDPDGPVQHRLRGNLPRSQLQPLRPRRRRRYRQPRPLQGQPHPLSHRRLGARRQRRRPPVSASISAARS
jgi:hypothetical protein